MSCHLPKNNYLTNVSFIYVADEPPPRPPLPAELGASNHTSSGRYAGHVDTTDDESDEIFQKAPTPSQGPIMVRFPPKKVLDFY